MDDSHRLPLWYHVLTVALVVFGMLAILSIGFAFLLTGLMLAFMGPFRGRPAVFWPPLVALWSFFVAFVLVAPWSCSQSASTINGLTTVSPTVCTNLFGVEYSGPAGHTPSLLPALWVAIGAAILAGIASRVVIRRRQSDRDNQVNEDSQSDRLSRGR